MTPIIDAHHHLWDPAARRHEWLDALPRLRRAFGITEYGRLAAAHGVTASVLVQVLADTSETEEFLALAAAEPLIAGVVGWADLTAPGIAGELARLRGLPGGDRLAGLRHLVQSEPDPHWLARPRCAAGSARSVTPGWPATCSSGLPSCLPRSRRSVRSRGFVSCWIMAPSPRSPPASVSHGPP